MAKKSGLGAGMGAVFASEGMSPDSINDIIHGGNSSEKPGASLLHAAEGASSLRTGVQIKPNLPAGVYADENGTLWVDPNLLKPNPRQPRQYFNEDELKELAESIKQEGVLSPIMIEDAEDGTFYIIAGERRTRASRLAGLKRVPVQLRKYSDVKKLEVALIENIQRTDLNPVEEAQAYYKLMEIGNLTQDEVAQRVGKNRSTVANCLRLLKLPEDIQRALIEGELTSGHARALLSVENAADQRILFAKIMGQGMSVREAESYARDMKDAHQKLPAMGQSKVQDNRDPNYIALEQAIIESLGTKVQLKGNFDKGSITISYFSKDDLDRIYNLLIK